MQLQPRLQQRNNLSDKKLTNTDKYKLSFEAHYHLVEIHPWADGNGRMSSLDLLLLGSLEKSRKTCGGKMKLAYEIMGNKLVLTHQQTKHPPASFTACKGDEEASKETKSLE